MPARERGGNDECDWRVVVIAKTKFEVKVFADDYEVRCLSTGDTIFKTYVPEWWNRSYGDYISFVGCLQALYKDHKIRAIKLVRTLWDVSLKEAKDYVDDLCRLLV